MTPAPAQPTTLGRDEVADEVRAMLAELTRPHHHREHYTRKVGATVWAGDHVTEVPPLIWQLEHAIPTKAGDDGGSSGFRSQPAAWLESLDTVARIDLEATRWVTDMGESDEGTTIQVVARLGGLLPSAHRCTRTYGRFDKATKAWCCTWHAVAHDVRRWRTQALVITGWQSPAWRPDNTCPMCGARGGLRVRLSEQSALCVECREVWQSNMIGLLAEHIRAENREPSIGSVGVESGETPATAGTAPGRGHPEKAG